MKRSYLVAPRCRHLSCQVNVKKYFDVDAQKWVRDKLEKIVTQALWEVVDDVEHNYSSDTWQTSWQAYYGRIEPWFTPRDTDWEGEV